MAFRGFVTFDEADSDRLLSPYQAEGVHTGPATGGPSATSGLGIHFENLKGGRWSDCFDSLGASWTKAWWHFAWTGTGTPSSEREFTIFYANKDPNAATGTVRVIGITDNSSPPTVKFYVEVYDGSAWVRSGTGTTAGAWADNKWLRLEIDLAGIDRATLRVTDGGGGLNATVSDGTTMIATATPCFEVVTVGGKGTTEVYPFDIWEVYCYDDIGATPNTAQTYGDNDSSDYHCFGNFPLTDVGGVWTGVGCTTRKALNVNDPQASAAKGDNYNHVTGDGTDQDDEYEVTAQSGGSATVEGVYIVALSTDSSGSHAERVDKLLAAVPSESGTPTADAGVIIGAVNRGKYWFLPVTPADSTAWTKTLFNELQVGLRNDSASTAERVYCMVIGTIGKQQSIPGAAESCPAPPAVTFVPRVIMC